MLRPVKQHRAAEAEPHRDSFRTQYLSPLITHDADQFTLGSVARGDSEIVAS
jgi:hypothetical protein